MLNPFDIPEVIKQFIPPQKQIEIQDHIIDILAKVFPNEYGRKLIQSFRSDAAFKASLSTALERAVKKFALFYEDRELVHALTQGPHFWDIPSVQSALQEIITRPSSYLEQEQKTLFYSFAGILPTMEPARVERAVYFFLCCLTQEVMTIPQLTSIYQVQFQWASLEKSHQQLCLQREQNQLMTTLVSTVTQNQAILVAPHGATLPKKYENLPPLRGECLGREKEKERVLKSLRSRSYLISIEGLGGVGKTTLAVEVARSCLAGPQAVLDPPFEYVVWVSAKDQLEQKLWLNEVLDTTARVLGYPALMKLSVEQKKEEANQLLHAYRTLLIIDNFETIDDCALESWIQDIPDPSKVLITSRTSQLRHTRPIDLKGLEDPAALELIRHTAEYLGLETLEAESEATLLPLVQVTGGIPKAIEMALGYIKRGRLHLGEVIENLHVAGKTVNNVFDDLFARVWNIMTPNAQNVLLIVPFFVDYASKEALRATTGLTAYHLDNAVEELVELKLLDIKETSVVTSQHYSIHPLTRAFARAQLGKRPEYDRQARKRWSAYYVDLAARSLTRNKLKEPYWNTLLPSHRELLDPEWLNLQEVLVWADEEGQDQILVDLMLLLTHYMWACMFFSARLSYAHKAAEAASRLGRKKDAALLYIDARGWMLLELGRLTEGIEDIHKGLCIAQSLEASRTEATELIILAYAFLARALLKQGKLIEASALIEKILALDCWPITQQHINITAGDIAYKKKKFSEAIKFYKNADQISILYGGEGGVIYVGNAYLASGDLIQAETCFNEAYNRWQHLAVARIPYAQYGLAGVALAKGERDKARHMAEAALDNLARTGTSYKLMDEIRDFLKGLEDIS